MESRWTRAPGHAGRRAAARPKGEQADAPDRQRGSRSSISGSIAIVTSPLPRARQTAEIVADALGLADRLETSNVLADRL